MNNNSSDSSYFDDKKIDSLLYSKTVFGLQSQLTQPQEYCTAKF